MFVCFVICVFVYVCVCVCKVEVENLIYTKHSTQVGLVKVHVKFDDVCHIGAEWLYSKIL